MVSATDMEPGISGSGVVLIYGVFFRRLGQVAEWQTRTVQVRVSVRTWGFNSPLAHSVGMPTPLCRLLVFLEFGLLVVACQVLSDMVAADGSAVWL
jgi:hypothetical protein